MDRLLKMVMGFAWSSNLPGVNLGCFATNWQVGEDYAYKTGTGPLFGGSAAGGGTGKSTASQLTATPTAKGTYDVWCDQGDSCSITVDGGDDMVSRERLPVYVPMASITKNCTLEFCYNSNQDVIGLNPEYYLWKK